MKPTKSILDPTFRYTPSASTDVRKTWQRFRREQAKEVAAATPCELPGNRTVVALLPKNKTRKNA